MRSQNDKRYFFLKMRIQPLFGLYINYKQKQAKNKNILSCRLTEEIELSKMLTMTEWKRSKVKDNDEQILEANR